MSAAFDGMAIAIDWLDAYRAAKLDKILDLYDDEASLECGCGGQKILFGKAALREYWIKRFAEQPAIELEDIQPTTDGIALAYQTSEGLVRVVFSFDAAGKIGRTLCGPAAGITRLRPASC
jgi:ketosteroid isomerase-like protein